MTKIFTTTSILRECYRHMAYTPYGIVERSATHVSNQSLNEIGRKGRPGAD